MQRVTGIGGVFLRAKDPAALSAWYARHLGIPVNDGYAILRRADETEDAVTVWATFEHDTDYFGSRTQQVMINYRVADLDVLETLRAEGVTIAPERSDEPNGRFAWVIDPEGNRIELWEPIRASSV
jgi:predicted enzyme related to lactoylglutathione lyase